MRRTVDRDTHDQADFVAITQIGREAVGADLITYTPEHTSFSHVVERVPKCPSRYNEGRSYTT